MSNCSITVHLSYEYYYIAMISVTFCLAKSRYFFIIFYCTCIYLCVYLYVFFYINNTAKGNTSLMLNKLLLLLIMRNIRKAEL